MRVATRGAEVVAVAGVEELEATADEAEREQRVRDLTAAAEENAKALNAAASEPTKFR